MQAVSCRGWRRGLVLAGLVALVQAGAASAELAFETTQHEFGMVEGNGPATFDFTFTNTGPEPVEIVKVRTTSTSAGFDWPREPVAPGARAVIPVRVGSRYGGHFRHELIVMMKDGDDEREAATLVVTGAFPEKPTE